MKTLRPVLLVLASLLVATSCLADQIPPPVFRPSPGPFRESQITVRIECSTPGVTIFYTTDGSEPSPSSKQYSGGITVSSTTTVKAKAYKFGKTESQTASGTWVREQAAKALPAPVLKPASFTFTAPVSVEATSSDSGAIIRYTTSGNDPTAASPIFPGRLPISETTTVKVRAFKAGMADSPVATAVYTKGKLTQVPAPVLDPPSTAFDGLVIVKAKCAESGAVIRYTENGTEPTTGSPRYESGAIQVRKTTTVKVRAFKDGMAPSPVTTAVYTLAEARQPPAPVLDPPAREFVGQVSVTARCSESGATIYYTLDGSVPRFGSKVYSGPVVIKETTTFKAVAMKGGMAPSAITTAVYRKGVPRSLPAPQLAPPSESFTSPFNVSARCSESGAVIRYTTNGSEPTASSPVFPATLTISDTTTIKARAFKEGMDPSPVTTAKYDKEVLKAAPAPVLDPPAKEFFPQVSVAAKCAESGAAIHYTLDGTEPSTTSPRYSSPILIRATTTVRARAFKAGMTPSPVTTAVYRIGMLKQVPAPVLDPASKGFTTPLAVKAQCSESGAVIRYTTNGSEPTASSPVFPATLTISESTAVKARAFKTDMAPSSVTTARYERAALKPVPAPVLDPPGRPFDFALVVKASCAESGAVIRYTVDGSEPTAGSPKVERGVIQVGWTMILKVRAFKEGMAPSPVTTAAYSLQTSPRPMTTRHPAPAPVLDPSSKGFTTTLTVKAQSSVSGAVIRYTTNGSEPTASSPVFPPGFLTISDTTTIKARTFKDGMDPSPVTTAKYEKAALKPVPAPVLDHQSKAFPLELAVAARCAENGAVIRYTTNGSEPTPSSPVFPGTLRVTATTTLKVRAFKADMLPSPVTTATYTKIAVTPTPAKGVVTAEERSKSAEECAKLLNLQRELERIQKEIEKIRKERTERRKKLGLDPDPDCRIR